MLDEMNAALLTMGIRLSAGKSKVMPLQAEYTGEHNSVTPTYAVDHGDLAHTEVSSPMAGLDAPDICPPTEGSIERVELSPTAKL